MNIVLILAKKGSKGLPGKNLILWNGKSLLEHTINHVKKTKLFNEIYVSTNCNKIKTVALDNDCKVILRNNELAKNSNYVKSVNHACKIIKNFHTMTIPMVVQPLRNYEIYKSMLNKLKKKDIDSVVTVDDFEASTAWIFKKHKNKLTNLKSIDYKNEIGRRNDLVMINNSVVSFKFSSWKKSKGITPWPYLGKSISFIKQKFINKNLKIDINDIEDKKWLFYLTKKLKWKKLY
jgi:CMP-N-acetylneuraminic acid synthetase